MAYRASSMNRPRSRDEIARVRRRLGILARLLDSAIAIPGTRVRFGLDAALGVIPVAGNAVTTALSAYIVLEAARLGVPPRLLGRMVGNIAVDAIVSAIPVAGVVLDVAMRANMRNVALLDEHLAGAGDETRWGHGPVIDGVVVGRA